MTDANIDGDPTDILLTGGVADAVCGHRKKKWAATGEPSAKLPLPGKVPSLTLNAPFTDTERAQPQINSTQWGFQEDGFRAAINPRGQI